MKYDIEKFTGSNDFGLWRIKMRAILVQQGLLEALKGEDGLSTSTKEPIKEEIMEKAHSAIILCLGDKPLREISRETTAAAVWRKLEKLYMTKSLANRLFLKQRLYSYKMADDKNITGQIGEFVKILDDLENIEVKLDEEDKALILLSALPRSFENFRDAMLYGREQTISLEEVQSAIHSKELQRQLQANTQPRGESLNVRGRTERTEKRTSFKFRNKMRSKSPGRLKCYICHKEGHFKRDCLERKYKQPDKYAEKGEASVVSDGYESAEVLVVSCQQSSTDWILDSGCSFHMCPIKSWFEDLKEQEEGMVLLGNDKACKIKGIGVIRIRMYDGIDRILKDVRFVPELKRNLISLGTLDSNGYSFKSENGQMKVTKGSLVVMKALRINSLYLLIGNTIVGGTSVAQANFDKTKLWHMRLGHVSEKGLLELAKRNLLCGDKVQGLELCEYCVLGKSKRVKFNQARHTTKQPLEYIHSDLWGPSKTLTHGGGKYFMSIIDDYSRRVWVYILKTKDEAFTKFKDWMQTVENKSDRRVKHLRTDNGLEYLSESFIELCKSKGITRHRTVAGTPQQNGLAERMNRTLLERVRCMILNANLSKTFWGEALSTACYLVNRCPSSAIDFKTPMELWSDAPADYSKLRVFGCLAYAHVRQDKLEPRALKCVFIGYPEGVNGYKVWNMESTGQKCFISRDVIFDETRMGYTKIEEHPSQQALVDQNSKIEVESTIEESVPQDLELMDNRILMDPVDISQQQRKDLDSYNLARDRQRRQIKPPEKYGQADLAWYALNTAEKLDHKEPSSFKEVQDSKEKAKWFEAMDEEMNSLRKNNTWELVNKPKGQRILGCKWIYKLKEEESSINGIKYKARLVAKGYSQVEGIDFNEIFSPVVKHCSIRLILALVNQFDLELDQLDVKTAFLNGDLEETIYMDQPKGYVIPKYKDKVCLLKKSLYGLKQSPRQWNKRFDEFMNSISFIRSKFDSCVYIKKEGDQDKSFLLLYVDDILIASKNRSVINTLKQQLGHEFEMKDLGKAKKILGMDIKRDRKNQRLFLSQGSYLEKVLARFNMHKSKSVSTPLAQHLKLSVDQSPKNEIERKEMECIPYASGVGSIMYGMVCSRPDLAYAISVVSRFMANPGTCHWEALKWTMRYLKGSTGLGLLFRKQEELVCQITGYVDSDYAGNLDTRKSLTGYIFTAYGTAISWKSVLQSVVALSTTEAEFIAVTEAMKEAIWLKGFTSELGLKQDQIVVHCDSQSAIHLSKHQVYHERSKHIDVKLHFVRDIISKGEIKLEKISTEQNPADALTKALSCTKFKYCLNLVNAVEINN